MEFLIRHRARQNRERLVAGSRWLQTGHTFASTIGTPLDERNVRREFYALLKPQSLPRMRPHDLRHSYATILLAAGEHPKVVQEILGHSSVQLTLDTYSHLLPDLMLKERAAAKMDAILSGGNNNPGQNPGQSESPRTRSTQKASTIDARGFAQGSKPPFANSFSFNRFPYRNLGCWLATFNRAAGSNSLTRKRFLYRTQGCYTAPRGG